MLTTGLNSSSTLSTRLFFEGVGQKGKQIGLEMKDYNQDLVWFL